MTANGMPAAEVAIDEPLVRALLREQHLDLADRPLARVGEGWDNVLYRLGDGLAVRLPRRKLAARLIEHEQRWLPRLAPRLPLPVPTPLRVGRPGCGFPWAWSIGPWFAGSTLADESPREPSRVALQLAGFISALHHPADADAPANAFRCSLVARHEAMVEQVRRVTGGADARRDASEDGRDVGPEDPRAILSAWAHALSLPSWPGPPVWQHGDLHPANLVARNDRLAAVIDFGDITAGDPAVDLAVAWMLFAPEARAEFRTAAASARTPVDDDTWGRARGWALTLAVSYLANSRDNPRMAAIGRSTIRAVLDDAREP